jgi:NadR type nicotinamide-nucleotide adenylyltransferase
MAWYGSSFVYEPPTADDLDAAAASGRAHRLARFSPEQFTPRPGGGDTSGVVLGRFLPVHDGHRYLVEFARAYTGRITAYVRVGAADPIPWEVRRDWLAELFPDVRTVAIEDAWTGETNWWNAVHNRWLDTIRADGMPDFLFSGEHYGKVVAGRLGIRHVPVDRTAVPVSGTLVRRSPWDHARHLPPCVRAWYVRRVTIVGAEGSGKSTLATDLARHYDTVCVSEAARSFDQLWGRSMHPGEVSDIAQAQVTAQATLARYAHRVLFCDTDPMTVGLWSERLFEAVPDWLREAGEADPADLYLLTEPEWPFEGSPTRDSPAERRAFHARIAEELTRLGRPFVRMTGGREQRVEQARLAVDGMLATPRP